MSNCILTGVPRRVRPLIALLPTTRERGLADAGGDGTLRA
jgi:hypothetical protein